jgi:hypothetical protein
MTIPLISSPSRFNLSIIAQNGASVIFNGSKIRSSRQGACIPEVPFQMIGGLLYLDVDSPLSA